MSGETLVSPREVFDTFYRCFRMIGADGGLAAELAGAARFAAIHLDGGLLRFTHSVRRGELPPLGILPVGELVAGARSAGEERVALDSRYTIADLAQSAHSIALDAVTISMEVDGVALDPIQWLSEPAGTRPVALVARTDQPDGRFLGLVQQRASDAFAHGLVVDDAPWSDLTRRSERYLVPESAIDGETDLNPD